jgi:hypothetical protein
LKLKRTIKGGPKHSLYSSVSSRGPINEDRGSVDIEGGEPPATYKECDAMAGVFTGRNQDRLPLF